MLSNSKNIKELNTNFEINFAIKIHAPRFCARPGAHPDIFLALSGESIPQQKSASARKH